MALQPRPHGAPLHIHTDPHMPHRSHATTNAGIANGVANGAGGGGVEMQPLAPVGSRSLLPPIRQHSQSMPAGIMSTGSPSAVYEMGANGNGFGGGFGGGGGPGPGPRNPSPSLASLYAIPPRRHGFQRPWHPSQMLVWSALCICMLLYLSLCVPFVPRDGGEFYALLLVYLGVFAMGLPCYIYVVRCDPGLTREEAQPQLERAAAAAMEAAAATPGSPMPLARVCDKCNLFQGARSKHCHLCRKCIAGFDHHCLYLNTCIGRRNYAAFIAMLTAAVALLGMHVGVATALAVRTARGDLDVLSLVESSALGTRRAYLPLLCVTALIPLLFLLLVASLWAFHLYIIARGLTTYEWILEGRKREADKMQAQEEAERVGLHALLDALSDATRNGAARSVQLTASRQQVEAEWLRAREAEKKKRAEKQAASAAASSASPAAHHAHTRHSLPSPAPFTLRPHVQAVAVGGGGGGGSSVTSQSQSHSSLSQMATGPTTLAGAAGAAGAPAGTGAGTAAGASAFGAPPATSAPASSISRLHAVEIHPLAEVILDVEGEQLAQHQPSHADDIPIGSPHTVTFHNDIGSPLSPGAGERAPLATALSHSPSSPRSSDRAAAEESSNPWLARALGAAQLSFVPADQDPDEERRRHSYLLPVPPSYAAQLEREQESQATRTQPVATATATAAATTAPLGSSEQSGSAPPTSSP